jgi:hypothetical protein
VLRHGVRARLFRTQARGVRDAPAAPTGDGARPDARSASFGTLICRHRELRTQPHFRELLPGALLRFGREAEPEPGTHRSGRGVTDKLYAILGLTLSLGGCAAALWRSRAPRSFYAADVYHMTRRSHRRFAALSVAFAAGFGLALRWPNAMLPLLAVYTLALILYASSFARGFSDDED